MAALRNMSPCHADPQPDPGGVIIKITVTISVTVEERNGNASTFALTRNASAGDNTAYTRHKTENVITPAVTEILDRVGATYSPLR